MSKDLYIHELDKAVTMFSDPIKYNNYTYFQKFCNLKQQSFIYIQRILCNVP